MTGPCRLKNFLPKIITVHLNIQEITNNSVSVKVNIIQCLSEN